MKIALLTDGIYPYVMGGMQKHSFYLAKYFARQKVFVDLYHYIPEDKKDLPSPFSEEELIYISLNEISYPKSKKFPGHYLYERYQYSKEVSGELKKNDVPDFIYAKGFAGWYTLNHREKVIGDIPVAVNFHGYEMFQRWPDLKTGLKLQILKKPVISNIKKADYLFSYGGKITEIIRSKVNANKIITIPSGISEDWLIKQELKKTEGIIKYCFVGRAERRKGIEELNSALLQLDKKLPFEFHFIGPIEKEKQLTDQRVIYHGPIYDQKEIQNILRLSDVLVCPSYSEGMPNVILEGMSSECAIIATDVGAVSEMVDEQNGVLLGKNIKADLKKELPRFNKMKKSQLHEMKEYSAQKVSNHFTWEKVIQKTIDEIQKRI